MQEEALQYTGNSVDYVLSRHFTAAVELHVIDVKYTISFDFLSYVYLLIFQVHELYHDLCFLLFPSPFIMKLLLHHNPSGSDRTGKLFSIIAVREFLFGKAAGDVGRLCLCIIVLPPGHLTLLL